MPDVIHLVRHGEVENPDGVVYADIPGFGLSDTGIRQARAAAEELGSLDVDAIVSSPLQRALETTEPIAATSGVTPVIDDRLTEWRLAQRWSGHRWDDLDVGFPGELEEYLDHPDALSFSPESIAEVASRMRDAVISQPGGAVVVVSHQDPIQALRLVLTGRDLATLNSDKPSHACIITIRRSISAGWREERFWTNPYEAAAFPPPRPDTPHA